MTHKNVAYYRVDSSLVCAIASSYYREKDTQLHLALDYKTPMIYAYIVAKHIDSIHHEIIYSEDEFIKCSKRHRTL